MLTPNGGVFGRNPKFNNVTVAGTLTSAGNVTLGTGANLVMASGNGISFAATSDPSAAAVPATGSIFRTATNVSDGDTVRIGDVAQTYTFKTALTPADYEVLIGADSTASLTNLANAINGTGGVPGTDYQVPAAHPTVSAGAQYASTVILTARTAGAAGNSIALSETSAQLTVSGTTLRGGLNATGSTSELFADYEEGTWTPGYGTTGVGFAQIAYAVRTGNYVKVGKLVTANFHLQCVGIDVTGATGNVVINGLPYASTGVLSTVAAFALNFAGSGVPCGGYSSQIGSIARLVKRATANGNMSDLTPSDMANGPTQNIMYGSIIYITQ